MWRIAKADIKTDDIKIHLHQTWANIDHSYFSDLYNKSAATAWHF